MRWRRLVFLLRADRAEECGVAPRDLATAVDASGIHTDTSFMLDSLYLDVEDQARDPASLAEGASGAYVNISQADQSNLSRYEPLA
jgi:hypothetical protein